MLMALYAQSFFDWRCFLLPPRADFHQRATFSSSCRCENVSHKRRSEAKAVTSAESRLHIETSSPQCGSILRGFQETWRATMRHIRTECFQVQAVPFNCTSAHGGCLCLIPDNHHSDIRRDDRTVTTVHQRGCVFFFPPFSILSDFSIGMSVRSTEEFSLSMILFQIHFCISEKKNHFCQDEHEKQTVTLQRSTALVVCSYLKEAMFMFSSVAVQEVTWSPYSGLKMKDGQYKVSDSEDHDWHQAFFQKPAMFPFKGIFQHCPLP